VDEGIDISRREVAASGLPSTSRAPATPARPDATARRLGPKARKIPVAMRALWPNGVPEHLGVAERDHAVVTWLLAQGIHPGRIPGERTRRRFFNRHT
jgi:hypothetical protein